MVECEFVSSYYMNFLFVISFFLGFWIFRRDRNKNTTIKIKDLNLNTKCLQDDTIM